MCLVLTHRELQEQHEEHAEFQSSTVTFLLVCELDQGHEVKALKMTDDALSHRGMWICGTSL